MENTPVADPAPARPPENAEPVAVSSAVEAAVSPNIGSASLALVNWGSLKTGHDEESVAEPGAEGDKSVQSEADIEERLQSPERDERAEAVLDLGRTGDKKNIYKITVLMLKDPDYQVRANAAAALSLISDPESSKYLIKALKDPVEGVRISAARSLGEFSDDASAAALVNLFGAASAELCPQIVYSLCRSEPGRKELFSVLRGKEEGVKIKILKTRGYCDGMRPIVEEIAADKKIGVELAGTAESYLSDVGEDDDCGE